MNRDELRTLQARLRTDLERHQPANPDGSDPVRGAFWFAMAMILSGLVVLAGYALLMRG